MCDFYGFRRDEAQVSFSVSRGGTGDKRDQETFRRK